MIRTCPKCGEYYADDSLAFCFADGTPLVNVDPSSESWSEGARVIEEKKNGLRKQKRRLKRRRVVLSAMTMLMATLVVCVVAVNSFIYLKPKQEAAVLTTPATPLPPATAPAGLIDAITPSAPAEPAPTPSPNPTATPRATRSPTPTPSPTITRTPPPTPSPTFPPTPSPTFIQTPVCSDADKSRERETIIRRFGDIWRGNPVDERHKIITENVPADVDNAEANIVATEYSMTFFKVCTASVITARYVWRVETNVKGKRNARTVMKEKRFACVKLGGAWLCRNLVL